ncbi:phosphoglycerate mutase [Parafrankia colletiae]|uniref:Phosphoglycerate mutase n=1 Tax=Parafrankia colletiae TaxID=573497 RepID=A0A1S1QK18_9ACTN|nr:histidine phosphatase family protein [Parafrankia colletiae]MCK9900073.1 histidine phosphatase family protein [Frankia sp. Cpl3]OHV33771.1 phosphoglycerate mutase [Parafrankia colletiae]
MSGGVVPPGVLTLIRHGETEWSRSGRHTGRTDIPLTADGEHQAAQLRASLASRRFVLVATSPRLRAARTADLAGLAPADAGPAPGASAQPAVLEREVWPDLAEWDYGDLEGETTPDIRRQRPGWTVFTGDVPGGESVEQIGRRADLVLGRVRPRLEQGDVALIGHSHMFRVLIARWLGLPPTAGAGFVVLPSAVSELGYERETPVLHRLNTGPI